MTTSFRVLALIVCSLFALPGRGDAQTINLAEGGADQIWFGPTAGGAAGAWLDQGAVGGTDSRRDLIVGAPGGVGVTGRVYIIYGGPVRTGLINLNTANVVINGVSNNDRFGFSTAAGNIWNLEGVAPRALLVGAPNAGASNAGRVYLFRGGFPNTATLNVSDALLEIRGQANDMLGYALATGDLNNDGYREMIIGAPGNNRVYIVNGAALYDHSGPTMVRDLAATPADVTITGIGGVGAVLNAGDVTNDDIYDLIIGAPDANAAYIIKGRPSTFPSTWNLLTTNADITFAGASPGDRAGASLRIADVDADGKRELLVGASLADGPGESRPDSGEVYMLHGNTLQALAGIAGANWNLSQADFRFYGRNAGDQLGAGVTAGDINRDAPNDLVFYTPGASGGGEWIVYYGRSRSTIGQLDANGVRIVDFGADGQIDRRIIGDPARGQAATAQVFEVTGEGARDIIIGVPTSDGGAGAAFFTISPKLRVPNSNITVVVNAGQSFAYPMRVENPSAVPITWATSDDQPWMSASPASGLAVASQHGVFNLIVSAGSLPVGTYTGTLTVASTSRDLTMALPITVTMRVAPALREPGDFDGDGAFDIIWQHDTQGWISIWRMRGAALQGGEALTPDRVAITNWKIVGTGDFNGDGHPDLLWHHKTEGWVSAWLMNGSTMITGVSLSPDRVPDTAWKIVGTGDFNGDGRRDILWQHDTNRQIAVWLMNGTTLIDGRLLTPSQVATTDWRIVGAGDFNGDGKTDIVWQNQANGLLSVWYMNGTTLIEGVWVNPQQVPDTKWKIRAVGDLNGDGKPDFVWQHTGDGRLAAWFMNGVNQLSGSLLSPDTVPDLAWKIVGPR